jgi:hypothetical protein
MSDNGASTSQTDVEMGVAATANPMRAVPGTPPPPLPATPPPSAASESESEGEKDASESSKEMHYRRGVNKVTTLEDALKVNITNSRMKSIMNQFESREDFETKKKAIIAFKAATDPSYLIQSSIEEIWMAVKRREAWAQVPLKMAATAFAQVLLCLLALLAYNAPVNTSTLVMAIIYAVTMASVNPFEVTWDLVGILEREIRKVGRKNGFLLAYLAVFLCVPLLLIAFLATITFDFFVGKVLDCSYGSLINIVVAAIVRATAISVGLRSHNPISAIQTFVGFDFISNMDEVIIATVRVDMKAATSMGNATPNWNQSKRAKMTRVRVALYIIIPCIVGFFAYTTAWNVCWFFCYEQ